MTDRLARYRDKRDASRTPEPAGRSAGEPRHDGPRHPRFLGLREDKPTREVVRER